MTQGNHARKKKVLAWSNKIMANKTIGKISQVIGAGVDVEFDG